MLAPHPPETVGFFLAFSVFLFVTMARYHLDLFGMFIAMKVARDVECITYAVLWIRKTAICVNCPNFLNTEDL